MNENLQFWPSEELRFVALKRQILLLIFWKFVVTRIFYLFLNSIHIRFWLSLLSFSCALGFWELGLCKKSTITLNFDCFSCITFVYYFEYRKHSTVFETLIEWIFVAHRMFYYSNECWILCFLNFLILVLWTRTYGI